MNASPDAMKAIASALLLVFLSATEDAVSAAAAPGGPILGGIGASPPAPMAPDEASGASSTFGFAGGQAVAWGVYALDGSDAGLAHDDLEPLGELIGEARIVGLGESMHGSGGFYRMKERVIRYLVEEKGFRLFALESLWESGDVLGDYLESCAGGSAPASTPVIVDSIYAVWAGEAFRDLIDWMCDWNRRRPGDQVVFFGFDVQQPVEDRAALIEFLDAGGVAGSDPLITDLEVCYLDWQPPVDQGRVGACVAALDRIDGFLEANRASLVAATSVAAVEEARIRSVGLRAWQLAQARPFPGGHEARDVAMADVFEWQRDRRAPHAKTVIWAHNGHVMLDGRRARHYLGLGEHLRRRHGSHYRSIGLFAHDVHINWPAVGCGGPFLRFGPDDLETRLDAAGSPYLFVDLGALSDDHPILPGCTRRSFGNYPPSIPSEHFDGALFLAESPAMVRLPPNQTCFGSSVAVPSSAAATPAWWVEPSRNAADAPGRSALRGSEAAAECRRPAVPQLEAEAVGPGRVRLTWQSEEPVDAFELERWRADELIETLALGGEIRDRVDEGLEAATTYRYRLRSFNRFGPSEDVETSATTAALDTTPCVAGDTTLCLGDGRFEVAARWSTLEGQGGAARAAFSEESSGLLWFFSEDNWEMLVKVLDGCSINDRFWVLATVTSDVGYELTVRDTATGQVAGLGQEAGQLAEAAIDTASLDGCDVEPAGVAAELSVAAAASGASGPVPAVAPGGAGCGDGVLCLHDGRIQVEVDWVGPQGEGGSGRVVPRFERSSGLFWFFSGDNWEMLVKVLDACAINDRFWVFFGATTDVGFELSVRDLVTGQERTYVSPVGQPADTVGDTAALPCR